MSNGDQEGSYKSIDINKINVVELNLNSKFKKDWVNNSLRVKKNEKENGMLVVKPFILCDVMCVCVCVFEVVGFLIKVWRPCLQFVQIDVVCEKWASEQLRTHNCQSKPWSEGKFILITCMHFYNARRATYVTNVGLERRVFSVFNMHLLLRN